MKKKLLSFVLLLCMAMFSVACTTKEIIAEMPQTEAVSEESSVEETEAVVEETTTEEVTEEEIDPAKQNIVGMNLLSNGDFSAGSENWGTYITKAGIAEFSVVEGVGTFDITATGTEDYSVQLYYDEFPLKVGGVEQQLQGAGQNDGKGVAENARKQRSFHQIDGVFLQNSHLL